MTSNLKNVYSERYNNEESDNLSTNEDINKEYTDMPIGWSFICLDETINYYTENVHKTFNKTD
uniref:Uncharacterized protein n=1 Tax=Polysiphonia sp. TaxID=1967842 RepID=A0A1Z1MTU4_9FLOR|nr:hypothetical protein [Polysiphonia sp.]